jgi:CCR4-NOT transcription complex subunit 7/8
MTASAAQMNPFSAANGNAFGAAAAAGLTGAGPGGFADTGFGSQSARLGFHAPTVAGGMQPPHHAGAGAHQQQQQHHHGLAEHHHIRPNQNRGRIREVWKTNLKEEMAVLRDLVEKYPYIAMVGP